MSKSARRCGAKHMSKSKCTKHTIPGTLLEVEMSKKCTPLWPEAHFQLKSVKKMTATEHSWMFRCRLAWQAQGIVHLSHIGKTWGFCSSFNYNHHYTPLHSSTFHYTALQLQLQPQLQLQLHYITLHYITLHVTTLHSTRLRSTTLHYTTLHSITLHNTELNYTTLTTTTPTPTPTLHYTTLQYTTLITLHYTTLHAPK